MANDEQQEELEVLRSIYGEDDAFYTEVNQTTFQFKFGADGSGRSFVLHVEWPPSYPADSPPCCSLDKVFYNKHLRPAVRARILDRLTAEAQDNIGMAVTFTLVEFVRDNLDELLGEQPESLVAHDDDGDDDAAPMEASVKQDKEKKVQMTKSQKRRMWQRGGADDERERGWNWIDVIKHLSQTGSQQPN